MWLLALIPNPVFYALFAISTIAILVGFLFNLRSLQIISSIVLVISTWYIGGISTKEHWEQKVREAEAKVLIAETKSKQVNSDLALKIAENTKLVGEITNANKKYIVKYIAKDLDASCTLTNASIMLNNSASQNEVPASPGDTIEGTSDVKASDFLATVAENYGTYYEVVEQVKGWQEWYYKQKKLFEEQ